MSNVSLHVSLPQDLEDRLTTFVEQHPDWSIDKTVETAIEVFLASRTPLVGRPPVALERLDALEIELEPGVHERLVKSSPNVKAVIVRAIELFLNRGTANG